jgi:L-lactate dehydrogenase complex protein LldG
MSLLDSNGASRAAIMGRVRAALNVSGARTTQHASAEEYLLRNQRGPQPTLEGDLVQRFIDWSVRQASTVERIASDAEIPAAVARYCDTLGVPREVVTWPIYAQLEWADAGVRCASRPTQGQDKTGVTSVTAGIAETGTILITPSATDHTASVLLPDNHIAIVPAAQIVATMEDGYEIAKAQNGGQPPRAMHYISGPSRTADIAQTLVIGAHGPIRVHVIVVG